MKELIEKKLEEHAKTVVEKASLSMDDINFLIYMLNRFEMKENAVAARVEKEASEKAWRDRMTAMLDTTIGGR